MDCTRWQNSIVLGGRIISHWKFPKWQHSIALSGSITLHPAVKARYFDQYLHSRTIQEDWITQSLRPFNFWNQTSLTEPYLTQALNELPNIKQHRKIFFLGAWLGAFIEGQNSVEAQASVQAWLASQKIDPDLRLKVLEVSDSLDRTVLIREKFPQ